MHVLENKMVDHILKRDEKHLKVPKRNREIMKINFDENS